MKLTNEDFFPSNTVVSKVVMERSDEFNIWENIEKEFGIEIGPRRMIPFFFNGNRSLILQYIFWAKKKNYLFTRRKISVAVFYAGADYIEGRLKTVEKSIEKSINLADIPDYHKKALFALLYCEMDRAFGFISPRIEARGNRLKH